MKFNVNRVQEGLRARRFGRRLIFLREVGSTNDLAKELASYGAVEGTVVVAETQRAGRGRLGRTWFSPAGGLYFSVVLRPNVRAGAAVTLVFVASLAMVKVLRELYGLRVETKWPNDVLVNGKKVCGILAEMKMTGEIVKFVVVGIGVNANVNVEEAFPEELRSSVTSLENKFRKKVELEVLFRALLEKLESVYELFVKEGFASVLKEWKKYASFVGCRVEVTSGTEKWVGLALDVESDGSLVMRLEDGTVKHVFVGDISLRQK